MELQIKTHSMKLDDGLREYIGKRVEKLDRINERITEAKFELREEPHHNPTVRYVGQFTIVTSRGILRAEEKNADPNTVVDLVTDKMARQIRRFHDRKINRTKREAVNLGLLAADQAEQGELVMSPDTDTGFDADGEMTTTIIRSKRFSVLPMSSEEAAEQMELLGHDFFVFFNPESSQMNVLYRRRDGALGLLEPELA
jgi:putative sigma-54 modulation protein